MPERLPTAAFALKLATQVKELEAKRHELRPEHYHVAIRRDNWRDEAHLVCRQWR
jgi:hypothetical protein